MGLFSKKKSKDKVSTLRLYTDFLFDFFEKGETDIPTNLNVGYFYYTTNNIYTKGKVKRVYFITELPKFVSMDFITTLKNKVSRYGDLYVKVISSPYELKLNSMKIKRRTYLWKSRFEAMQKKSSGSVTDEIFKKDEDKVTDEMTLHMMQSWKYILDSRTKDKEFCSSIIVLEFVADSIAKFKKGNEVLAEYLDFYKIMYKNIFMQTNEYYKSFSPMGNVSNNMLSKMNKPYVITDEIASRLYTPNQGIVGDEKGVYVGTDIFTARPITFDFRDSPDAVNILVTAITGGGKSGYLKGICTYFKITGYSIIILDYEGDEYDALCSALGGLKINMGKYNGNYYDTTEIGDLSYIDDDLDDNLKQDAVEATKLVFDLLSDENNGMTSNELAIFNDAIYQAYDNKGVTEDKETWKNSKGMSYFDIYNKIVSFTRLDTYTERYGNELFDFLDKLKLFFDKTGMYYNTFKHRISIQDIRESDLIVFSFGMRGVPENNIDKRQLALKQLLTGYLSMLVSNYNKFVKNSYTVNIYEEVQRYITLKASASIINNAITGGRKRNMINILASNAPDQLINASNLGEGAKNVATIMSNMTGVAIGALKDDVTKELARIFNVEHAIPTMLEINSGEPEYKYCFLTKFKGEVAFVRFNLPDSLVKTALYVTRKEYDENS